MHSDTLAVGLASSLCGISYLKLETNGWMHHRTKLVGLTLSSRHIKCVCSHYKKKKCRTWWHGVTVYATKEACRMSTRICKAPKPA